MLDGDTLRAYLIMWWLHIYYSIYHGFTEQFYAQKRLERMPNRWQMNHEHLRCKSAAVRN